jgi:hypothetical protein
MADVTGLLRNVATGLGRHACRLACSGRNRVRLMIVDVEQHKEE